MRPRSLDSYADLLFSLQIKKDATFIISKIHAANNLFQPIDNFTNSLAEVSPCFSAYLERQEYEKPPVKLEVEMACNTTDANLYEKAYARWSRAGRGDNVTPLEVFMARLDGYAPVLYLANSRQSQH